jgi:hypothetical protein
MSGAFLLTMTNSAPGKEQEFEDWYRETHLPEVVAVPSVSSGKLHTAVDQPDQPARWRHAALYGAPGDPEAALSQVFEYGAAGKIAPPTAIDPASVMMAIATPITDRVSAGAATDPKDFLFLVLTNPVKGKEDEYNRWYNDDHIDDVLAVPGFVGVQRFRLSKHPAMPAPEWDYVALYEVAHDKVQEAFEGLAKNGGTDAMPLSDALELNGLVTTLYRPVSTETK